MKMRAEKRILVSVALLMVLALTPVPGSTSTPTYTLSGVVFFDYNGNGVQEQGEPGLEGIEVAVGESAVRTDTNGHYSLTSSAGTISISLIPADPSFQYYFPSPAQVRLINRPITVHLSADINMNFGIGQGVLTVPLECGTDYLLWSYTDYDYRIGFVRNYAGDTTEARCVTLTYCPFPGTFDQHQGTDYNVEIGTPIVAAAPGVVMQSEVIQSQGGIDRYVRIKHDFGGDYVLITTYGHNSENLVSVGTRVRRGQAIALSGDAAPGGTHPHLHFGLWAVPRSLAENYGAMINYIFHGPWPKVEWPSGGTIPVDSDPYRDLFDPEAVGYWIQDNSPMCPGP